MLCQCDETIAIFNIHDVSVGRIRCHFRMRQKLMENTISVNWRWTYGPRSPCQSNVTCQFMLMYNVYALQNDHNDWQQCIAAQWSESNSFSNGALALTLLEGSWRFPDPLVGWEGRYPFYSLPLRRLRLLVCLSSGWFDFASRPSNDAFPLFIFCEMTIASSLPLNKIKLKCIGHADEKHHQNLIKFTMKPVKRTWEECGFVVRKKTQNGDE